MTCFQLVVGKSNVVEALEDDLDQERGSASC